MVSQPNDDEKEVARNFQRKYRGNYVNTVRGVSKPIAKLIVVYFFGDKFISLNANKEARKFDVFVKVNVSDAAYEKFKKYWQGIFNIYKSSDK